MIKVEIVEVWGFEHAIRGMRNPLESWGKSDSYSGEAHIFENCRECTLGEFFVGKNDLNLMQRLYKAGTEHRKYLRQIFVSMDITAPLYWWKEFDTYKIGTVANSCSTMHKIHAKKFTLDDFGHEHLTESFHAVISGIISDLNCARKLYRETNDKTWWWQMIQILPSSYNQKRTITMNYENVMNIINQRSNHKLDEWINLVGELKKMPYVKEIRGDE